jgi:cyclic pyranopterin phosphate synthase
VRSSSRPLIARPRCFHYRGATVLKPWSEEGASDDDFEALIRRAVEHKELKHRINERGFVRASRTMSQIGG